MDDLKPLIEQVFAPKKGESVLILNDFPSDDLEVDNDFIARRHFARHWYHEFLEISKKKKFSVKDMITYEPTGTSNKPLPKEAHQHGKEIDLDKTLKSLGKKDIVLAITRFSATAPLRELVNKQEFRAASMPGVDEDMTGFEADYNLIRNKAKVLAEKLTKAVAADVEFSTSNKIHFDLRGYDGHIDDGNLKEKGKLSNLPAGEAFICPYEGFDKKLGKSLTQGDLPVFYGEERVVFHVEEGKIAEIVGIGKKAERMRAFFELDDGRKYIAELGLGCNEKAEFCGKTIQDEKIEGMHFAYGYNGHFDGAITKDRFKSEENIIHQDIVYSLHSKVHVRKLELVYEDDSKELILEEGKYVEGLFD